MPPVPAIYQDRARRVIVEPDPNRYRILMGIIWTLFLGVLPFICFVLPLLHSYGIHLDILGGAYFGKIYVSNAFPLWLMLGCYIFASVEVVQTTQNAGIIVIEVPSIYCKKPGWYVVPLLFAEMARMPRHFIPFAIPATPELIERHPDLKDVPLGRKKKRPLFVTCGPERPEVPGTVRDPLNSRITAQPQLFFLIRPQLYDIFQYYILLPGRGWHNKMHFLFTQVFETCRISLTQEFAKAPPSVLLSNLESINQILRSELNLVLVKVGFEVEQGGLTEIDVGVQINDGMSKLVVSKTEAEAKVIGSEAEKTRLINEAAGQAEGRKLIAAARVIELSAEGEGLQKAAEQLDMSGSQYVGLRMTENAINKGTTFFGVSAFTDLLKELPTAVSTALGKPKAEPDKGDTNAPL